jgi:hypothetical protein
VFVFSCGVAKVVWGGSGSLFGHKLLSKEFVEKVLHGCMRFYLGRRNSLICLLQLSVGLSRLIVTRSPLTVMFVNLLW